MTSVDEYIKKLKANRVSDSTIENYNRILQRLNAYKPLELITSKDLQDFFNTLNCKENTFVLHQAVIKKYFKDIGKPEIAAWIKRIRPKETLHSDDILTTDEINKMIESTDSHYYKALIAFLYETGCRISEARLLRYSDFKETDKGMIIHIKTQKTHCGDRKIILPFSSQYIRNLKTYINAKGDDIVFNVLRQHTNVMLHNIALEAGITKPIHCHLLRHAQATDMVKRSYNEAIIRKKLGWSNTSTVIARYQHLNDEDVINATLENHGKLPQTATPKIEIKEADRLSLVDAAMQFSKLSEENSELKIRLAQQENRQKEQDVKMNLVFEALRIQPNLLEKIGGKKKS